MDRFCYEAGPCGYVQRQLTDKVKTDRRDAMMLAQTLRAGQLTFWVPDEAHEAMRDLGRLRAQAMRDLRKTRQQLLSFLLRHGSRSPYGHWTKMHRRWLGERLCVCGRRSWCRTTPGCRRRGRLPQEVHEEVFGWVLASPTPSADDLAMLATFIVACLLFLPQEAGKHPVNDA